MLLSIISITPAHVTVVGLRGRLWGPFLSCIQSLGLIAGVDLLSVHLSTTFSLGCVWSLMNNGSFAALCPHEIR